MWNVRFSRISSNPPPQAASSSSGRVSLIHHIDMYIYLRMIYERLSPHMAHQALLNKPKNSGAAAAAARALPAGAAAGLGRSRCVCGVVWCLWVGLLLEWTPCLSVAVCLCVCMWTTYKPQTPYTHIHKHTHTTTTAAPARALGAGPHRHLVAPPQRPRPGVCHFMRLCLR